jgi:signal transduction histidine kinase
MTQRAARITSRGLLVFSMALLTLSVPLSLAASERAQPGRIVVVGDPTAPRMAEVRADLEARVAAGDDLMPSFNGAALFLALVVLLWLATGAVIVSRQPGNWAGWILMTIGLVFPLTAFCEAVIAFGVRSSEEPVPGATIAAVVGEFALYPVALLPLLFLWFPDGRPPSPRWRWASRALLGGVGLALVGFVLRPGPLNNLVDMGTLYDNPLGVDALAEVAGVLIGIGTVTALLAAFSTVLAVRQRFKRSTGEERQRMRWLVFVATVAGVLLALQFLLLPATILLGLWEEANPEPFIFDIGFGLVSLTIFIGVPGAYLVAILRYRLWDLDVVIRKTILYGLLVGLFLALGAVLILVVGQTIVGRPSGSQWVLVVAGLAMGLLFLPLRQFAGRLADRIVYRRRATPYQVLTTFAGRVGDTYASEDILPRMAEVLAAGLGAEVARVWLRLSGHLVPEATWPAGPPPSALPLVGDALPAIEGENAFEVQQHGEILGALSVRMPASDPMNGSKERLARDLASQAGPVLRNVRLIEELRASRQRLVAAQDEERRKIERNIHDGAQQQLVALQVKLGLAKSIVGRDPDNERELLEQLQRETQAALEDLRDLARGIYPPLLADRGLLAALEAQARKATLPVQVEAEGIDRYSQEAEAAVYFCALEALQNMAKYAEATKGHIRLAQSNGQLTFEVRDDGRGFDPAVTTPGSGLTNMADRLEALGGSLTVTSQPGAGTTVTGSIPVEAR